MFNAQMFECPTMGLRKSFYGNAQICHDVSGIDVLNSYNRPVCMVAHDGRFVRLWDGWSATTARHVNAFRMFHNMPKISKSEWFDLQVE